MFGFRLALACILCGVFLRVTVVPVHAGEVLGVHILNTGELQKATQLLRTEKNKENWQYITIPFTLEDIKKQAEWQAFFSQAKESKFRPIVRLATRFEGGAWAVPTRKDIVDMATALEKLDWPDSTEQIVIIGNEPNHKTEWGGSLNPEHYADVLSFAVDWFHTSKKKFIVLPAGLDLAAPNGAATLDAFHFLERMLQVHPDLLERIDGWTSHSYPNPAFSGRATDNGRNSIRGYRHELDFLARHTQKELPVYITETGWVQTPATSKWLRTYYEYAFTKVWSDPRIKAVTPFLLQGQPGPFGAFSFFDANGKPTRQYEAYRQVIERL